MYACMEEYKYVRMYVRLFLFVCLYRIASLVA